MSGNLPGDIHAKLEREGNVLLIVISCRWKTNTSVGLQSLHRSQGEIDRMVREERKKNVLLERGIMKLFRRNSDSLGKW